MRYGVFILFWFFGGGLSWAQDKVYVVKGVEVDVTAPSAEQAQKQGFEEGQVKAFDQLVQEITQKTSPLNLSSPKLVSLVESHGVDSEKRSNTRYRATLTFKFNKAKVDAYLKSQGRVVSAPPLMSLLVIPLLQKEGGPLLWEEENTWFQEWENHPFPKTFIKCELPEGTLHDRQVLSAQEALSHQTKEILELVERYGTQGALVLHKKNTEIRAWYVSLAGEVVSIPFLPQPPQKEGLASPSEGREINYILREVEDFVKKISSEKDQKETDLEAVVVVKDQSEWVSTYKSLRKIPSVKGVKIEALSAQKIEILIHYVGDLESLKGSLHKHQLDLQTIPGGDFMITPRLHTSD